MTTETLDVCAKGNWRAVPGWEGRYEVSDRGEVRSWATGRPRILRQFTTAKGYRTVQLGYGRETRPHRVHRLVLEAFTRTSREGEVARHLNGNPQDNTVQNLAWGTASENAQDIVRHGRGQAGKTHCPAGHSYAEHGVIRHINPPSGGSYRTRACRLCTRRKSREYMAAVRAANRSKPCPGPR